MQSLENKTTELSLLKPLDMILGGQRVPPSTGGQFGFNNSLMTEHEKGSFKHQRKDTEYTEESELPVRDMLEVYGIKREPQANASDHTPAAAQGSSVNPKKDKKIHYIGLSSQFDQEKRRLEN